MTRALDVYLHKGLAGHLIQDENGKLVFEYAENWLKNPQAMALSNSLLLRKERFTPKECAGFFNGILPEESGREIIAKILGISARNDFSMLEQIGGECAGAVSFIPTGQSLPAMDHSYLDLSSSELAERLKILPRRPLLAGEDGVRMSLAGAQIKLAVKVDGETISIPLNGAPSTHILKPANAHFPGLVFNELLCLTLAKEVGLPAPAAEARTVEGMDYFLVARYDRKLTAAPNGGEEYARIHQEDFCQALGIISKDKYQREGGPSLKQCFALLREVSSLPVADLNHLLDAVIFNYLIGNNDAHGKNFSLLHHESGTIRFAPLYDLVSTAFYPDLSQKMAMKIGGEYYSDDVTPRHFEKFAEEAGLAKPIVKERIPELANGMLSALPGLRGQIPPAADVADLIEKHCRKIIAEFSR